MEHFSLRDRRRDNGVEIIQLFNDRFNFEFLSTLGCIYTSDFAASAAATMIVHLGFFGITNR